MTTDKSPAEIAEERAAEAAQKLEDAIMKLRAAIEEGALPRDAGLRLAAKMDAGGAQLGRAPPPGAPTPHAAGDRNGAPGGVAQTPPR
ncbi:hypothetical protein, partial [Amycolatopsis sp. NPDC059020]|uniref:hypothetical protein n=1 Tax=Amycolatopsis sp. NPDC059020 TaxID=3346703 RepID=UPI00366F12D2